MPSRKRPRSKRRKTYKRTFGRKKRKTFKAKRKKRTRYIPTISRAVLPKQYITYHNWSTSVELAPSVNAQGKSYIGWARFRANNIYDPDYASELLTPQHAALGYIQMKDHYRKYIVLSSHITATPVMNTTSKHIGYTGIRLHKYMNDISDPLYGASGTVDVDPAFIFENNWRFCKVTRINQNNNAMTDPRRITISCGYKARKAYGKGYSKETDFHMKNNEKEGPNALSPDTKKNYYYTVWSLMEPGVGTQSSAIAYRVSIRYKVMWFDKEQLTRS